MSKPAGIARVTRIEFGLCQHVLYLNRSATLWADRNHGDRRFQQLLDTFQVLLRGSRQVFVVANIGCIALPALDLFIDGLAGREVALRSREAVDEPAVELIGGANFDGRECIEYIEFCDDGRVHAVQLRDKTPRDGVEPAAATGAARVGAKLVAPLAHLLAR